MEAYLTNNDIICLKNKLQNINKLITDHTNMIEKLKHENDIINEELKRYCNHNKVIDHSMTNEHTEYICSKCGLIL
jgi:hypothetical protein